MAKVFTLGVMEESMLEDIMKIKSKGSELITGSMDGILREIGKTEREMVLERSSMQMELKSMVFG